MAPAVYSSLVVALWFTDRALDDGEYIQPQKLHRLLYLSQAYFAVANRGRKLMPAVFVADEYGPIEPNVFHIFETGRPMIEPRRIPDNVVHFLDSIWRRFGAHSADHLTRVITAHPPFRDALAKGPRSEIPLAEMQVFYGNPTGQPRPDTPAVGEVLRPRVMRSQTGKPVEVRAWMPPSRMSPKK